MSSTGTQTKTYTVADIRRVVENFAADFSMMALATGIRSRENVALFVFDLQVFAEYSYLTNVTLILKDKDGNKMRAAVYTVSESATGWKSDRPGNNLWPKTPDGSLFVLATLTDEWWHKTDPEKETFVKNHGLNSRWAQTKEDTSLHELSSSAGQQYSSNGYGWERKNYS